MDYYKNPDKKVRHLIIAGAVFMALAILFSTRMDMSDEELEEQQYCDMVRAHMRDKNVGWPDFKGIYKETCVDKEGQK